MFGAYGYKNTLVGNLASQIAKQKAKQTKKIMGDAGKEFKKKGKKWSNTNEGKLITGVVGGYMRNRGKINKALNSFKYAVE